MASKIVTSLYVAIDGIFAGLGFEKDALGAINIARPFIIVIVALTMMVTIGGVLTEMSLAKKENDKKINTLPFPSH